MKSSKFIQEFIIVTLAAAILVFLSHRAQADTNFVNRFDAASEVDSWAFDFGSVTHANSFDPTMDGNTNASSGSMKITFGFSTNYAGDNKGAYTIPLSAPILNDAVLDLDSIHLDLKIDPASTPDSQGFNGYFALAFRADEGWFWRPQFGDNVGTNYQTDDNGWRHFDSAITLPGPPDTPTNIHRITLQLYGGPVQNIEGPVTLWIDNLYYTTFTTTTSPPPTMTLARTVPGLNITASVLGDTYQRQDIRTADANSHYSWINPTNGPVTYSFTITNFPSAPAPGFEAHMLLVGNHQAPGPFADWNETNVVYLRLYDVGGHFDQELYYKVNADHSSSFANFLGRLSGPTPIGTWGITLAGTNVTMFGPSGTLSTNTGTDVLTAFNTYTYPYIGIIPNNIANVGQSATFSAVSISGATTALDEHFRIFSAWKKNGITADPTGVLLQPSNTFAKILWPFPQTPIYSVHATNSLGSAPTWPASGLTINTVGTNKVVLLANPTNSARFFRLETP